MAEHANVSSDLIWEVCSESAAINESTNSRDAEYAGPNNAFLVKRKSAGGIVNYTVKQNYRADLRQEAVARASAIRQSNQAKKGTPEKKARGVKAKAVAEKDT
ncbi:MAG: hypothetical protein LQ348_007768 [Seirophora lacunosa]|nr:MAG: hypothetical protein LQ348_007768 [Seirophora lacunosa]